jgi:hypothetical protein
VDELNRLALERHAVLTPTADRIAPECGFVKRGRKGTGSTLAQAVVFTGLGEPGLSQSGLPGVAATVGLNLSRQGLDQRFTPVAAEFLTRLLADATTRLIDSKGAIPLLDRFTAVEGLDSSTGALPDDRADVSRGGQSGPTTEEKAAVPLTVGWDRKTGPLRGPELGDGRAANLSFTLATADPRPGGLGLADRNSFSLEKFPNWGLAGAYWLSRLQVRTAVDDGPGRRLDRRATRRAAGITTWTSKGDWALGNGWPAG